MFSHCSLILLIKKSVNVDTIQCKGPYYLQFVPTLLVVIPVSTRSCNAKCNTYKLKCSIELNL